jgi:hypothetical protein
VVFCENGQLVCSEAGQDHSIALSAIPLTRNGTISFQIENACPRNNPNYKVEQDNIAYTGLAEGSTEFVKHCVKCNIGVYSEHENKDHRTCTFCGERE